MVCHFLTLFVIIYSDNKSLDNKYTRSVVYFLILDNTISCGNIDATMFLR